MNWLIQANQYYSLLKEAALLQAIGTLEKFYDQAGLEGGVAQLNQDFALLEANDSAVAAQKAALNNAGVNITAAVEQWNKVKAYFQGQIPDNYQALGFALTTLKHEAQGTYPIRLPLLDKAAFQTANKIDLLALSAELDSDLVLSAEALPQALPSVLQDLQLIHVTSLSLTAKLALEVEAGIPQYLDADANISHTATAQWFFKNEAKAFYAQALARNLLALKSPFQLPELATSLATDEGTTGLGALTYQHEHARSYGGKLSLHKIPLPGLKGSVSFSGSIAYRAQYKGVFTYAFYLENDKPTLTISRAQEQGSDVDRSLTMSCDLAPLYADLKDLLFDPLNDAYAVLDKLDTLFARDLSLKSRILASLEDKIDNQQTRLFIQAAFGFGGEAQTLLSNAILSEVESSTARWSGDASEFGEQIVNKIADSLKLKDTWRLKLKELIKSEVEEAIASESQRLKDKTNDLLASEQLSSLFDLLGNIGYQVVSVDQHIDELIKPVRAFLSDYQHKITELKTVIEAAATTKLTAEWDVSRQKQQSDVLELKLRFNDVNHPQSQALYQQILTGRIDALTTIMQQTAADSELFEIVAGELTRVLGYKEEVGLGVTLIGLELERKRTVSSNIFLNTNAKGDILVQSELEIGAQVAALGEGRTLGFVNIFALATARETRLLDISLNLSSSDNRIKPREWQRFWSSLHQAELLSKATFDTQIDFYEDKTVGQDAVAGTLGFSFDVKAQEINQLLGLDDQFRKVRTEQSTLQVIASEMAHYMAAGIGHDQFQQLQRLHSNSKGKLSQLVSVAEAIAMYDKALLVKVRALAEQEDKPQPLIQIAEKVNRLHQHAVQLNTALRLLRAVYTNGLNSNHPHWSLEEYESAQQEIDDLLSQWLKVNNRFFFFVKDEVRDYTLAFMRILARLAGRKLDTETDQISVSFIPEGDA